MLKRILKEKKGFTLVEVLVATSLLVLVIAVSSGIIISAMNGFSHSAKSGQAYDMCSLVYDYYESRLSTATKISVNTAVSNADTISVQSGRLHFKKAGDSTSVDVYRNSYSTFTLRVTTSFSGTLATLKVEILDGGELKYQREGTFRLITLERTGSYVAGTAAETANPTIYIVN